MVVYKFLSRIIFALPRPHSSKFKVQNITTTTTTTATANDNNNNNLKHHPKVQSSKLARRGSFAFVRQTEKGGFREGGKSKTEIPLLILSGRTLELNTPFSAINLALHVTHTPSELFINYLHILF